MIEVTGLEAIQAHLKSLQSKTDNMKSILYEVGAIVRQSADEAIENQTSPFGQAWAPLSNRHARAKAKKSLSAKALIATGALSKINIRADSTSVIIGTNATSRGYAYPAVHQFGSKKESGRGSGIPARPFLPIDEAGRLADRVQKDIMDFLVEELLSK